MNGLRDHHKVHHNTFLQIIFFFVLDLKALLHVSVDLII